MQYRSIPVVWFSLIVLYGCGAQSQAPVQSDSQNSQANDVSPTLPPSGEQGSNNSSSDCTYDAIDIDMLAAVNSARAASRMCGTQNLPAVPALTLNCKLTKAAQLHSEDMATHRVMSHTGSDGSSMTSRISAQNYSYSSAAENVAYGYADVDAVMTGWLESPGHCANIMRNSVVHLGVGFAIARQNQRDEPYWTQNFAKPR